ncbi:isocitrate lyase/phosphoenolpyruvate mutase family protein [Streptomyces polyrhachis]|uniref:Isocitrate lyase/phosphoenolpyruvate mutase family protein n=1 Tax=Streptomyces polyrhachis TaxID=1282885 RepID=A0ABW2GEC6_9ACTN
MNPQSNQAAAFRALHVPGAPLLLPNAWDAASARITEDAGAAAVATTSAGVAWSLGVPDGDALDRASMLAHLRRVVAAVRVPVSADIESGFGATPREVAATVREVIAAGAVGVNIEDGHGAALRPVQEQAERIAAARRAAKEAGVPLYINARTDAYLYGIGTAEDRLPQTLARAAAYLAAGADGVFVPGVTDPATVSALAEGIGAPLNILAGAGAPTAPELAKLGVARISLGSSIASAAYELARKATRELLTEGTYEATASRLSHGELNGLLRP